MDEHHCALWHRTSSLDLYGFQLTAKYVAPHALCHNAYFVVFISLNIIYRQVDISAVTDNGRNAFHAAAHHGHIGALKMIYEHISTVWSGEVSSVELRRRL